MAVTEFDIVVLSLLAAKAKVKTQYMFNRSCHLKGISLSEETEHKFFSFHNTFIEVELIYSVVLVSDI